MIKRTTQWLAIFCLILFSCQESDKADLRQVESNQATRKVFPKLQAHFGWEAGNKLNKEKLIPIAEYVRRIFRDSQDNLWLATNSLGVARFDGDSLTYFSTKNGLSGDQVTGIIEDQNGHIWFSTNDGVTKYDGENFMRYTTANGLSSNSTWSIFEDSRGTIWVGTVSGLSKIDPSTDSNFKSFTIPKANIADANPRFSTSLISSMLEDKDGNIWFGTDGVGVCKYNPLALAANQFEHFTKEDGLCGDNVVSIVQAKDGSLWFSSRFGGLSQFDGKTFTTMNVENGKIGDNEVWTMFEDNDANIWFSSEGFGIYKYDGKALTNFGESEGLPILAVQAIFQDKTGLYWVGGGGGLYIFDGKTFDEVGRKGPWGKC